MGIGGTRAGDKPQHQAAVQRDDIRGIQLLSHQNGRARQAQRLVGLAVEYLDDPAACVQDIAGTLAHVRVLQCTNAARKNARRALHRCRRTRAHPDIGRHLLPKALVLQQHPLHHKNIPVLCGSAPLQPDELVLRLPHRVFKRLLFLLGGPHRAPQPALRMAQIPHRPHRQPR